MNIISKHIKIYVDVHCEVESLLRPIAIDMFNDFDKIEIEPGAVYVIGRNEMARCYKRVKEVIDSNQAHIVFSNPAEGSSTMHGQFQHLNLTDWAKQHKLLILAGGDMESDYKYLTFEHFAYKLMLMPENVQSIKRTQEIFDKKEKPYKFLFLNGRMRTHRKYMLAYLRQQGLLDQGLWSCLHARNSPNGGITLMVDGQDLMAEPEQVKLLDANYEIDRYVKYRGDALNSDSKFVKFGMFRSDDGSPEWGEVYLKPDAYIDTYFSIVTETVYDTLYSFRTEKIWKPIAMGHPWIAVANSGFYRDMQNLGFDTFGHVFDTSFDNIVDTQKRIERIAATVKEAINSDLQAFLSMCESSCKYNQQRFLELRQEDTSLYPIRFLNFIRSSII
jgi:hypothetical protein